MDQNANQNLGNQMNNIHIENDSDSDSNVSADSGEGSIIYEEEGEVVPVVEDDDGVVIDHEEEMEMDADDNRFPNDDRVGGNHPTVRFTKHTESVFWCDLDPVEGKIAVTGSEDEYAYVWDTITGETMFDVKHSESVSHVGFSYDGKYIATGDMTGLIQVWTCSKDLVWSEKVVSLQWLLWHKESHVLIAAQESGELFIWKIPSGQCKVIPGHGKSTECGALMPDGKRIVVGYNDRSVKVFDLKNESVIANYKPQNAVDASATDLDVSKDDANFVASFTDGMVLIGSSWSTKTLFEIDTKKKVEAVKFAAPDVAPLVAIGSSHGIDIWDYSRKVMRHSIDCTAINRMCYDPNRRVVYAGGVSGEIYVVSFLSGSIIYYFVGHRPLNVLHIAVSKDCTKLLTASEDSRCNVYDLSVLDSLSFSQ